MKKIIFISLFFISTISLSHSQTNSFEMSKNIEIYVSLLNALNSNYADDIYPSELIKNSIDGMLQKLDPYTVYITESEIEDVKFLTTGEYGGIGSLIIERENGVYISEIYPGTPAQRSNLRVGDKIVKIDGKAIDSKNYSMVSDMMKGQAGTICKITVERIGTNQLIENEIKREHIKLKNVSCYGMLKDNIAYIRLDRFAADAAKEVLDAFVMLKDNNKLNGLILDLRGNPGGLLNEAVDICNIFIPRGKQIVSIKGKQADRNQSYYTTKEAIDTTIPIVVLVDEYSASSSEIVAGAIQDLDRGIIMGTRTFGKGLVQNILPLPFNTQLKITTAKYYIPSGRCIQEIEYFKHDNQQNTIIDSTTIKFKTMNGRTVYGGGGVTPDIECSKNDGSEFLTYLIINFYMFDYAAQYINTHNNIDINNFTITEQIFQDFTNYIVNVRNINFTPESETIFNELCDNLKENGDYDKLQTQIDNMKSALAIPIPQRILDNKSDIEQMLYASIIMAAFPINDSFQQLLNMDKCAEEAITILADKAKMKKILRK